MLAPLWIPSPAAIAASPMDAFRRLAERASGRSLPDSVALHAWSIEQPEIFWPLVWDYSGLIGDKGEFAYPRPDFKGIVMVNPDTLLLTHAHPLQRQVLYSLRLRPEQTRVEQPGREAIQVHYKMQMQADPKELIAYQQINEEHLRHCA